MFETEQVLRPDGSDSELFDLEPVNDVIHDRGLPADHVVFHDGFCISSWDQSEQQVCTFSSGDLEPLHKMSSIDIWYNDVIRREFAARYGLTP
jgi:hypothetical protein